MSDNTSLERQDEEAFLQVKQTAALVAWNSGCDMRVLEEIGGARNWAELAAVGRIGDPSAADVLRYLAEVLRQPLSLAS